MGTSGRRELIVGPVVRRAVDVAVDRLVSLPPRLHGYRVTRGVRVPMRDGVELIADLFVPRTRSAKGTVLIRGPYGRGYPSPQFLAQPLAARGYHVLIESCRGTYGSGGLFEPVVDDPRDGLDTIAWLRTQPWFDGRVATIGGSYLGLTQWAVHTDPPDELKASVLLAAPHDMSAMWRTGSFALDDYLGWSEGVAHQGNRGEIRRRLRALTSDPVDLKVDRLPLDVAARDVLGSGAPWYWKWLSEPDRDSSYWRARRFDAALDRTTVPLLLINGWQDVFLEQTFEQYERLRERGVDVAMTIGPWQHRRLLPLGVYTFLPEALAWLSTHLAQDAPVSRPRVRVYVTGHEWLHLDAWPPPMPELALYPAPDGSLNTDAVQRESAPSTFVYDPADPTPSIGGRILSGMGWEDDAELAARGDTVTFTGVELPEAVFVVGVPRLHLSHSADNPHVDVFARVSEVAADGSSVNVTEGFRRLPADVEGRVRELDLELDPIAHRFAAGSRIRLVIAGGSFPRFARNSGTDEPLATAHRLVPATHRVHHGEGTRLVLPAGDRLPGSAG